VSVPLIVADGQAVAGWRVNACARLNPAG
jgi:hypothetical protein